MQNKGAARSASAKDIEAAVLPTQEVGDLSGHRVSQPAGWERDELAVDEEHISQIGVALQHQVPDRLSVQVGGGDPVPTQPIE